MFLGKLFTKTLIKSNRCTSYVVYVRCVRTLISDRGEVRQQQFIDIVCVSLHFRMK